MSAGLNVVSTGAVTAVGLSSAQTCTAIRAGISAFAESEFHLSTVERQRILAAAVPLRPRPADSKPGGRLVALARLALTECLRAASLDAKRTALVLGVPESHRADAFRNWFDEDLYEVINARIVRHFHHSSLMLPYGNASGAAGLIKARAILEDEAVDACVVAGVDSFLNGWDIERLERTWRLLREGEANGLVPGEAGTCIAVTTDDRVRGRTVLGIVEGVGLDREDGATTVIADGHPTGKGLQRALDAAVRDADVHESMIGLRVTDLNGERYGSMDSMLAVSRFYRTDRDGLPIWHPAECVGETGAAVGPLLLQIACHGFARGYAPSRTVMCEASSESGHRSGCVVRDAGVTGA